MAAQPEHDPHLDGLTFGGPASLQHLLTEYFHPTSNITSETAASEVDSYVPGDGLLDDFAWEFWRTIVSAAEQIFSKDEGEAKWQNARHRLVDLIVAVEKNSTSLGNKGLSILGQALRDVWAPPARGDEPSQAVYVARNAFVASLFQRDFALRLRGTKLFDWKPNLAVWTLRDALEEAPEWDIGLVDCRLTAAAQWVSGECCDGRCLYEWAMKGAPDEGFQRITRPGGCYHGPPGINLERWALWQKRFYEQSRGLVESMNAICLKAAMKMEEVAGSADEYQLLVPYG